MKRFHSETHHIPGEMEHRRGAERLPQLRGISNVDTRTLIWVDLRLRSSATDLCTTLPSTYHVRRIREPNAFPAAVTSLVPLAVFFEYDNPGPDQLEPLQRTRLAFPSLPVLMITVEHSEALAVWALRARVWDYLVMPVHALDICSRVALLAGSLIGKVSRSVLPGRSVPEYVPPPKREEGARSQTRLLPALSFVEANYSEKISLRTVAGLCDLGPYQFSRAFKHAHGTTFREFLIVHRINKAIRMLEIPSASITDVAFAVGFNDLSHFAQMFRRYVGVCPSQYLHEKKIGCLGGIPSEPPPGKGNSWVQDTPTRLQQNPSS
jgi:AraC-like DNA-binding protein